MTLENLNKDIDFLKKKVDSGADVVITQLFFENKFFYSFRDLAVKKGIKAFVCDVENDDLPFKSDYFDCIVAGEIIEHIFDTDAFIDKCKRVLKKNGVLIITTPNCASLRARLSLLLGRQPAWVEHRAKGGAGHIRAYTLKGLLSQLKEHGFNIEGVRANEMKIPFIGAFSFLGDRCPSLGDGLIVKARKR